MDPKKIAIFGIGSPFGMDNIGQQVIEILKIKLENNPIKDSIQLEYFDRPGLYLLDYLKNFKIAHLVDAVISGKSMGTIHRYETISDFQADNHLLSSHDIGVAEVLKLGETLHCLPETLIIHGLEIENVERGLIRPLSSKMVSQCENLAERIKKEIIA